ncbi:hypothetical protein Tco_1407565 [Tanacetum coccineum]
MGTRRSIQEEISTPLHKDCIIVNYWNQEENSLVNWASSRLHDNESLDEIFKDKQYISSEATYGLTSSLAFTPIQWVWFERELEVLIDKCSNGIGKYNLMSRCIDTIQQLDEAKLSALGKGQLLQWHEQRRRYRPHCKGARNYRMDKYAVGKNKSIESHELDFDDLYNNLKVYEHELKGVSNSNSQNIAFLSTEVKGSTLKQSTAEPAHIPKRWINSTYHRARIAMEEIDIRWQVAMITARIRKFMRKTGRPIDLKPKNGITFDKSKIECFNLTYAMMALTGVEQDDWSIEFDAEHMHFGQDGLDDFDWSNKADDALVSLALMATNSENEYAWGDKYEQMEYDLKIRDLKLEEKQKELDQALKERDDFKVKLEKWTNASVLQNEVLNKQRYVSDKSCIGFGIESSNSMESDISSGDETLTDSAYENFKREKAYKAVPPPTGTIIPPRANVSFTGIDELAIRNKVVNQEKTKLVISN